MSEQDPPDWKYYRAGYLWWKRNIARQEELDYDTGVKLGRLVLLAKRKDPDEIAKRQAKRQRKQERLDKQAAAWEKLRREIS